MTDFRSLVFYVLFFLVSTLFVYLSSKRRLPRQIKSLFMAIGVLIPTAISGLRGRTVGTDTPEYIRMYSDIINGRFDTPIEPLTTVIAHVSSLMTTSSWLFFSLFALISTVFFYLAATKIDKRYAWFMWFLYLFIYFTFSFNVVRQMAAVSILFYAVTCLVVSRDKRLFMFWALVAACTHAVSAIAAILFYIFYKMNDRQTLSRSKVAILTIGLAISLGIVAGNIERVVSFIPFPIFQKVLDNANRGEASLDMANAIFYLAITLVMIALYGKIRQVFKGAAVFAMALSVGSILIFLDNYLAHAGRLAYFFVVPALPTVLYAIVIQAKNTRRIITFTIMIMAVALFVATRYLGGGSDIIPYYIFAQNGGAI
ncbi:EpsG family protein [Candidatus Saccharibacteria bacterium]|nr:MAG: EpsG family protein [Candidatus Saccharibacteria bacterium]